MPVPFPATPIANQRDIFVCPPPPTPCQIPPSMPPFSPMRLIWLPADAMTPNAFFVAFAADAAVFIEPIYAAALSSDDPLIKAYAFCFRRCHFCRDYDAAFDCC